MGIQIGKWRLKLRGRPVGRRAVSATLSIGGFELLFFTATTVAIFLRFREKIVSIASKVYQGIQEQECAACGPSYVGWIVLLIAIAGFLAIWKVKEFRHLLLGYLFPIFGTLAVLLLAVSIYSGVRETGFYIGLSAFIAFVIFCCFCKIEKIVPQPLSGRIRQWPPKK